MTGSAGAHVLPPEVQSLHLELVTACEQVRPPCRGRNDWTSEDPRDRAAAVEACGHCPHQAPCGAYAKAAREHHGVWAGKDRTSSASSARRRATKPQHVNREDHQP